MGAVVALRKDSEPTAAGLLAKHQLLLRMATDPALSRADVAVGAVLLEFYNCSRGCAWPSLPKIAERSSQTVRNVQRCIVRLTERSHFLVTKSQGRGNAKTYRPNFGPDEKVTPPSPFPPDEKMTVPSPFPEKDDSGVAEKVTAVSGKGDGGVTPYCLRNQLEETEEERENSLRSSCAREGQPALFPAQVEEQPAPPPPTAPRKAKEDEAARAIAEIVRHFDVLWWAFPSLRRAGRAKCLAMYRKIIVTQAATAEEILAGAQRYAASDEVSRGFACALTRWLNEERWTLSPAPAGQQQQATNRRRGSLVDAALAEVRSYGI